MSAWGDPRRAGSWWWAYTERDGVSDSSSRERQRQANEEDMSKADPDDMRAEYDFSGGVRGKHHEACQAGTNVVFLDSDVARVFKDSVSVNRALRLLLDLAKNQLPPDRAAHCAGNSKI